jgi:hypothetical protein
MAMFEHCHKMVRKLSFDKTFTKRAEKKSPCNGTYKQCCQLFAELYGQSSEKFGRRGKNNSVPQKLILFEGIELKKNAIFFCESGKIFLVLPEN